MNGYTVIRAKRMIDGTGAKPVNDPTIVVKGDKINRISLENEYKIPDGEKVKEIDIEDLTILPGLVDTHIHLTLGTNGGYSDIIKETDDIHLMAGIANVKAALNAGITTMMDAGSRNFVGQSLRQGIEKGLVQGPRLLVAGRPLTITGGHFHFCNDNEADGVDQVVKRIRQFVKEDVDYIKIMASGGGSANIGSLGGPNASQVAFNQEEINAAVSESHKLGRITTAHCEAFDSVNIAATAGVDILCHCGFILPDGSRGFDDEAVRIMAEKGLYYNPTLQTGSDRYDYLKAKKREGKKLSNEERKTLENLSYKFARKFENLVKFQKTGVKIVAGSDATGLGNSTRLLRAMEMMADAGMTPLDVINSATYSAAQAFKMEKTFGAIKKGLKADLIAVRGNPENSINDLRKVSFCMKEGEIIV